MLKPDTPSYPLQPLNSDQKEALFRTWFDEVFTQNAIAHVSLARILKMTRGDTLHTYIRDNPHHLPTLMYSYINFYHEHAHKFNSTNDKPHYTAQIDPESYM